MKAVQEVARSAALNCWQLLVAGGAELALKGAERLLQQLSMRMFAVEQRCLHDIAELQVTRNR